MSNNKKASDRISNASVDDRAGLGGGFSDRVTRLAFSHRYIILFMVLVVTVAAIVQLPSLKLNASFDDMIPQDHPYIRNYFETRDEIGGLGNAVRVVVANPDGTIFEPEFLKISQEINETLFLMPGVDRAWMKSIWMSSVRWTEVTELGFQGGAVMPDDLDVEKLKKNIASAGLVGSLVGTDKRSLMYVVPLLDVNPQTQEPLDYADFAERLEQNVRQKFQSTGEVEIHIVGFAKLLGDLIDGMYEVFIYFAISAAIVGAIVFLFVRCLRSTALVILCSFLAVVLLLGAISALGESLNPYTILVPFLVFAIGVSHGSQIMYGTITSIGNGFDKISAAEQSFRRLIIPGLGALISDCVGFLVLTLIDIPVIGELAISAGLGVFFLVFTNLLLLPVLMSFSGVNQRAAERAREAEQKGSGKSGETTKWAIFVKFTERPWALGAVAVAAILIGGGFYFKQDLQIGDLDAGAPELRPDSRYNQDVGFINSNYAITNDQFVIVVRSPEDGCSKYETLRLVDDLVWELQKVKGVHSVSALPKNVASLISGLNEANPKWISLPRNEPLLGNAAQILITDFPEMVNASCSIVPVYAYLSDHKAETLQSVVTEVEAFTDRNSSDEVEILLASGPSGIEAVTNIVVEKASLLMLIYVYAAVALVALIVLRSWRAVLVAMIPLYITSVLAEALMASLGIGVKVATLPVVALGVGIGVDYALYLLSIQMVHLKNGLPLKEAYRLSLASTGKVVALVGFTLAIGVVTWSMSPIKFQADMGLLLAFMFLFNMLGALIMVPALSHFFLGKQGVRNSVKHSPGSVYREGSVGSSGSETQSRTDYATLTE